MTVVAGNTIEKKFYHCYKARDKNMQRAPRAKETSWQMEEVNRRNAEDKLRWMLNTNFREGDYHLVLNYKRKPGDRYREPEEMKADMQRFLRRMRAVFRKADKEFKYVYVFEIGEKGSRHIHIVMNNISLEACRKCWEEHGRVTCTPLDNHGDYGLLANYLMKYSDKTFRTVGRLMGKRYSCSRNMIEPKITRSIVRRANTYKRNVRAMPGYYVDVNTIKDGVDAFGYCFFKYTLVKLE
jgi:hypothetical protein